MTKLKFFPDCVRELLQENKDPGFIEKKWQIVVLEEQILSLLIMLKDKWLIFRLQYRKAF